ncbi:MAG: helix-turn-helix transcriptional regulator [Gammaproteobacteria bacterium]|nr:helix-turn-helix transcriptional regulator [Gammaproteobacteria bacterium]
MKQGKSTATRQSRRSPCPVASALDLLGDKWSLLVVRDVLFLSKRRYNELLASPEGIPSNILAERLRRLEQAGLLRKQAYQRKPVRYEYHLTPKGTELLPVFRELIRWANRHITGTVKPPPDFFDIPGNR